MNQNKKNETRLKEFKINEKNNNNFTLIDQSAQ